jgi:hypothetical protein
MCGAFKLSKPLAHCDTCQTWSRVSTKATWNYGRAVGLICDPPRIYSPDRKPRQWNLSARFRGIFPALLDLGWTYVEQPRDRKWLKRMLKNIRYLINSQLDTI